MYSLKILKIFFEITVGKVVKKLVADKFGQKLACQIRATFATIVSRELERALNFSFLY